MASTHIKYLKQQTHKNCINKKKNTYTQPKHIKTKTHNQTDHPHPLNKNGQCPQCHATENEGIGNSLSDHIYHYGGGGGGV